MNEKKVGLGYVLKSLRIINEFSIKELANRMNVSSSYISEVESGNKRPSLDMLTKYADALGVSRSSILYFDEMASENEYNFKELLLNILEKLVKKHEK